MAFTDSLDVTIGDATKASDYDNLADNTEFNRTKADVDHDFNISTGTGKHKTIQFLADSTYNVGSAAARPAIVFADTLGDSAQDLAVAATVLSFAAASEINTDAGSLTLNPTTDLLIGTSSRAAASVITGNRNASSENDNIFTLRGSWNGNTIAEINLVAGPDAINKDDGLMTFDTAGPGGTLVERMRMDRDGRVFIGDGTTTSNIQMTIGLTLDLGANDNEALAFKSNDVAHTMTDVLEADTYGVAQKASSGSGGLLFTGATEGTKAGIALRGFTAGTTDTTKTTSGHGAVVLNSYQQTANTITAVGADGNLCTIENAETTRFIFDAEGSGHADVEWVAFSDARLKTNIKRIPYGLAEVIALQPKIFDKDSGYIDDAGVVVLEGNKRRMLGFMAQEAKALMPEITKDVDESTSFYSLDYGRFTPVLWRAIQELAEEVKLLKEEKLWQ